MYHTNSTLYPKNVSIAKLEALQALYRKHGIQVRYRFRGPRRRLPHQPKANQWSYAGAECLRENAVGFSVYPDNRGHWDDRCVLVTYRDLPEKPFVYIKSRNLRYPKYPPVPRGQNVYNEIVDRTWSGGLLRSLVTRADA